MARQAAERRQDEGTREKILAAARVEFIDNGLRGARMQEIANRAGVNKALLHYHFRDKETLYRAVLELATQRMKNEIFAVFAPSEEVPPEESIRRLVRVYVMALRDHPDMVGLVLRELADGGRNLAEVVGGVAPVVGRVLGGVDREMRRISGGTPAIDGLHVLMSLFSMCWGVFLLKPVYSRILSAAGVRTEFDDAFLEERVRAIADMVILSARPGRVS